MCFSGTRWYAAMVRDLQVVLNQKKFGTLCSKTRRPGSGEISSRGFIYYWSGMSNGARLKRVAIGGSSRLQPSVVEVIPVDERIM